MRLTRLNRFVVALTAFSCLALSAQVWAQGLKFASEEKLRGIPLASTPFSGAELPAKVDLSSQMPPVGNQGKQGSCVAWSVAYGLKSYQERVEAKGTYHFDNNGHVSTEEIFSPGFVYNQLNQGRDAGCEFPDALNLLSGQGAAPWVDMPYNESDFTTPPTEAAKAHAKPNRIDTWRRVNVADTNEIKAHVAAGFPVMIGAQLDEGFLTAGPEFVWKEAKGQKKGGHAMLVVGYDDQKKAFKVLNSWGMAWGDHGYGWIDYSFFREVVREGYVAKNVHKGRPTPVPAVDPHPAPPVVVDRPQPDSGELLALLKLVNFRWGKMAHNIAMPRHPEVGPCLALDGRVDVPPGLGSNMQVVMFFFFDKGDAGVGDPVPSRMKKFATVQGMAADGTEIIPIGERGIGQMGLMSIVPYATLEIPAGGPAVAPDGNVYYEPRRTNLVAVPVLFIDGFGVTTGPAYHFFVMR